MINSINHEKLTTAAEQMLTESVLCWQAWDKLEAETLDDCIITHSSVDFPFFNNVMSPNFNKESASERIEELLYQVGKKEKAVCWWLGMHAQPDNLGELLEAAGAFKAMENQLMAIELKDLPEAVIPKGIDIVEVTMPEQLRQWTSVVAQAHGIPEEIEDHWTDMYQAAGFGPESAVTRHFLALIDGKPVGATSLITAAGVCSVANVATDANYRHQGIGSAMTLWPLKVAEQQGYSVACLSASADGEPVYIKLGFQNLQKNAVYLWMPPSAE